MAELFLIGVGIYWLATDTSTALWVIGGVFVLIVVCAVVSSGQKKGKRTSRRPAGRPGVRIEHPHVIDDTDYECSVCGHRFGGAAGSCPSCGTVFGGEKTDYEEFDFEEDELEAWDEEDGW